jgi:hypothetical protein
MVIEIEDIDISKIEDRIIRENYVFGLGFPQQGDTDWIVLRAIAKGKENYWLYDPIAEGLISGPIPASTSVDGVTNHGYVTPQIPKSQLIPSRPTNIFQLAPEPSAKTGTIYQLFFGIAPDTLRVLFEEPAGQNQMSLPVQTPSPSYNQFGAILGRDNRINQPGKSSEIWVPPGLDFAIGFINDTPDQVSPLMVWVVNYFRYEKVKDPDTVYEVLNTTKYKALRTVGGVYPYSYSIKNNFGQEPVTLGMSKAEIRAALGV